MIRAQKICLTGLLGLVLMASSALGEAMMFKADLKPASEVPPALGSGEGNAMVTLDTEKKTVAWKATYRGLSGTRRPPTSTAPPRRTRMPGRQWTFPA